MRKRKSTTPSLPQVPFAFLKVYSFGPPEVCVAALEVNDGYFALEHLVGPGHIGMFALKKSALSSIQFRVADGVEVAQTLADLKAAAFAKGATLEAIQLMGVITPLTNEEELTMAQAGTKLSRKTANKEELKAAAKSAPVKGKAEKAEGGGRKGNAEALAKAREAKAANTGPDKRKITVKDPKNNPFRDGSGRASAFQKMVRAKTVQDYLDAGGPAKYVKKFQDMGHISVD